jgi:NAD(P)-dependent dehydrogenase (short-subunit alcohol dehydrogenase family)
VRSGGRLFHTARFFLLLGGNVAIDVRVGTSSLKDVTCVTETDLTTSTDKEELKKLYKFWIEHMSTGCWGKPIKVAALAIYLASDASEQVTGAIFTIDGGYPLAN